MLNKTPLKQFFTLDFHLDISELELPGSSLQHIEPMSKLSIYPLSKQTKGLKNNPRLIGPGFHSAVASIWSVKIILIVFVCLWLAFSDWMFFFFFGKPIY